MNKYNTVINEEIVWKIIEIMLKSHKGLQLIRHHIESYELFLEKYIPEIIQEHSTIQVYKTKKKHINKNKNCIYSKLIFK